jgi:hypothetical protein
MLIAGPLVAHVAATDGGHHGKGIQVSWSRMADPNPTLQPIVSPPSCTTENRCVFTVAPTQSLLVGDLVGTLLGASAFGPNSLTSPPGPGGGVAIYVMTLNDSPCGAGSLTLMVMAAGPGDGVTNSTGVWQIAPGAGTGDLTNITGSGHVSVKADLSQADYDGRISCNS